MYRIRIGALDFEWDEAKNETNMRKHGIAFREAIEAFRDINAPYYSDPDDLGDEERFLLVGLSPNPCIIVVCHRYRDSGASIRIISARKATTHEENEYQRYNAS